MAGEWVPAVTAGIAAAAALGGQGISGLIQGRNQERMEARQRRQQAAEVLAEVRAFLTDVTPDRLAFNANEDESPRVLQELGERQERLRVPLLTLATSHPSERVRDLARRLEVELANTLHQVRWLVRDLFQGRDFREANDEAKRHHAAALDLVDQLVDVLHRPEPRWPQVGGLEHQQRKLPGPDKPRARRGDEDD